MQYLITTKEKRRQHNLLYQLWRLTALSLKFMKLTRLGDRPAPAQAREGANRGTAHPA